MIYTLSILVSETPRTSSERNFLQIIQLFTNSLTLVAKIANQPELSKNCHSCLLALPSPQKMFATDLTNIVKEFYLY